MPVNNYNLSKQIFDDIEFFTPVKEAIVNSILAEAKEVRVILNKKDEINDLLSNKIDSIQIIDTGHGFNEECQKSFENLAESNKSNCKGLGRLSFIQVFDNINIKSTFLDKEGQLKTLDFKFDENFKEIDRKNCIKPANKNAKTGTIITFSGIKDPFADDTKNQCKASSCFAEVINDVLPHLCFNACKLLIEASNEDKKEFDLKDIQWKEWKKDEEIKVKNSVFKIRYFKYEVNDETSNNYFLYLAKDRAVKKVFPRELKNFPVDTNKKLIVVVSSDLLDSKVSVNWNDFKILRRDWNEISPRIKKEIGGLISNLVGDWIIEQHFKEAKKDRPDLLKMIDKITGQERWIGIAGKRDIIEEAKNIQSRAVSKLIKSSGNEEDLEFVRDSALMQLVITRWTDLSKAAEICNNEATSEKEIHNLLYTQKTDSNSEEVNRLWLLDSRWQYAEYISSENILLEMLGLNEDEKDLNSLEIFAKHGVDLAQIADKLSDENFKKEFNKRPDIAIFNDDSVVIIELKKPGVDLINHTEKIKYYASLIAFLSKNKYRRFYCYLLGSQSPILNHPYKLTADRKGYFDTGDLFLRKRNISGEIEEESTNAKFYYEVCEYNKFLKDCYFQHLEFFRKIGKKIERLEQYLPEKFREVKELKNTLPQH